MNKTLKIILFTTAMVCVLGFSSLDEKTVGFIMVAFAAGLGAGLAYLLFKDVQKRKTASIVITLLLFFAMRSFLLPYVYAATYESDIQQKFPIYAVIATYYPDQFKEYITKVKQNILEHGSVAKEIAYSTELTDYAMRQSMPFAPIKDVYNFLVANTKFDNQLYSINPMLVLSMETPRRIPDQNSLPVIGKTIPQADLYEISQAKKDLIVAGSKNRTSPVTITDSEMKQMKQDAHQILSDLNQQYGKPAVDDTFLSGAPFADPVKSAQIMISFQEKIVALGEVRGGLLYKEIVALSTHEGKKKPQ